MPKNSKIIIAKNVRVDRDYINVCDADMLSVVNANAVASASNYSFIRKNRSVKVSFTYAQCVQCNYMAFQNPDYSNRWFFAWIDSIEYVGENTCQIDFTIDHFSTWWSALNKTSVFVEREHVNNDNFGVHSLPEPVKPDKLIINHTIYKRYTDFNIIVFWLPAQINADNPGYAVNQHYNTPANVNKYAATPAGVAELESDLSPGHGLVNANIISIFMCPTAFIDPVMTGKYMDVHSVSVSDTVSMPAPTNLDGYVPVNKKMLTYPYNFIAISNGNIEKTYKYEKFGLAGQGAGNFKIVGAVIPNGGATMYPMAYDGVVYENVPESLTIGDFPMVAIDTDSYAAWLAQKSSGVVMQGIMSTLTGALAGGMKGGWAGAAIGAGAGLVGGITNYMSQEEAARAERDSVVGTNETTVDMIQGLMGYTFCQRCAVADDAERIDRFFSQFGYNVSICKVPNYTGRQYWNYVKINGSAGYGALPEESRVIINNALNKGVTIWHSHNNIGNYFIGGTKMQNPII